MQVSVRIAGTGRVVPHAHRFDSLDRHLHLTPTRADLVVACCASQTTICDAARSIAASYASATNGCSAAASDHVFDPLTTTSTNRTALASVRNRPRASPVSGSRPATQGLIAIRVKHADTLDPAVRGGDEPLGQPRALGQVVVVDTRVIGLDIVPSRRCAQR